ncbi:MAG: beta-propeller domain-containing protein [Clostridia bacterium]|nr:beta-propeller domain-containing protein [Clostridia bacterium]
MNKERLIFAIGDIDEKYIKEAESRMNVFSIIKVAAVLLVVTALSLFLFIPFAPVTSDLTAYESSSYYPLIEGIEDYRLTFMQPRYKNNYESITKTLGGLLGSLTKGDIDMAPGMDNMAGGADMEMGNGSYVEATDNQVDGVIESDIFKMTDKYIFRLGHKVRDNNSPYQSVLRVYSIEKENSTLITEYILPEFTDQQRVSDRDINMYLSLDAKTVTVISNYRNSNGEVSVGLTSLDVSDVNSISLKGQTSIDGTLNTSRYVDGKLLLVTNYSFSRNNVDYNSPDTFVPTVDNGNGAECIEFENIIYPEQVTGTGYTVVALLDAENLDVLSANALLNFTFDVYVSENNIYISREYVSKIEEGNNVSSSNMSDVAVLGYSGGTLEEKGVITVRGHAEDQFSFDERDGYLRVVTSTRDTKESVNGNSVSMSPTSENVSLYIFNLADNSLAYKVEDFAIEGEEATAVRFDSNMLYVCTAEVVTFTDPVYFIDLSDYENIGSVDTGVIEGFSESLISYGEGLLLGIGQEDWSNSKVEIYMQEGEKVTSVHKFKFNGSYALDYKAFLVNRDENLFGFGVDYFYEYDEQTGESRSYPCYILMSFDESEMVITRYKLKIDANTVRAAYIDGYLYITTPTELVVENVK